MSQRNSGRERVERDAYETPGWVTLALLRHLTHYPGLIWEPAAGSGKMVRALEEGGFRVVHSDISDGADFLQERFTMGDADSIITNPPYEFATEFVTRSLALTERHQGIVALLLRTDFDHASSRRLLFGNCRQFAKKVVLTKRIQWFEDSTGSPSFNHAWFIWDWQHSGPPTLAYGPA